MKLSFSILPHPVWLRCLFPEFKIKHVICLLSEYYHITMVTYKNADQFTEFGRPTLSWLWGDRCGVGQDNSLYAWYVWITFRNIVNVAEVFVVYELRQVMWSKTAHICINYFIADKYNKYAENTKPEEIILWHTIRQCKVYQKSCANWSPGRPKWKVHIELGTHNILHGKWYCIWS